ncbi:TadA family conjugal transfer-associated ATPase [Actinotalea sp. K2]|uniref:TadA family conjugal transfer-associated ATPase n=1 Tax=Actinotalea sp. K2 TaxID=2939438 RepID=UPI0020170B6A|nr:TadA family conjugal transfer-associated ATPase [Actinotalea sp. K2]MCL3861369.1 TadA family conjugal transfer-associated ATPase [Actinotalea sp. K2]
MRAGTGPVTRPDRRGSGVGAGADAELVARVRERAAAHGPDLDRVDLATIVRELGGVMGRTDRAHLEGLVRAELHGAGPLQGLLEQPGVSDVLVNGPREVWVDRGRGLERADLDLGGTSVRALAVRLAAAGGQRLDDAAPVVDARLPDGTRLHAVLPPVAGDGALISLRVLRRRAFSLDELVRAGSVAPALAPVLRALVSRRANLLVSGATGTGKTTLLATLLGLVPAHERIVCIEEARELAPDHPHVVGLVARRANVEGAGEVDLASLVRHALRMRPDRLVLGECRGAEVRELLTALNTGHEGGCGTLHANSVEEVPTRLEALGALAGMPREAVAAQAASALHAVVHLRREEGRRQVAQVGVVHREPGGELQVVPAIEQVGGRVRRGPAWQVAVARWGLEADAATATGSWPGDGSPG